MTTTDLYLRSIAIAILGLLTSTVLAAAGGALLSLGYVPAGTMLLLVASGAFLIGTVGGWRHYLAAVRENVGNGTSKPSYDDSRVYTCPSCDRTTAATRKGRCAYCDAALSPSATQENVGKGPSEPSYDDVTS